MTAAQLLRENNPGLQTLPEHEPEESEMAE